MIPRDSRGRYFNLKFARKSFYRSQGNERQRHIRPIRDPSRAINAIGVAISGARRRSAGEYGAARGAPVFALGGEGREGDEKVTRSRGEKFLR